MKTTFLKHFVQFRTLPNGMIIKMRIPCPSGSLHAALRPCFAKALREGKHAGMCLLKKQLITHENITDYCFLI
jgi:hypothetical protein